MDRGTSSLWFRSASTPRPYTTSVSMSTQGRERLHALRASTPAARWLEAYPVGNGVRGAMCAGLAGGERLWLNDVTAWSGQADADPLDGAADRGPDASPRCGPRSRTMT